ncbi:MAG: hypothetical protein FWG61_01305 [Firmicutes bacterium]|nr:hypothetical protein [Bacillota bacterium]
MKSLVKILHITAMLFATSVIISIFYEGMVLRWFSFIPPLIAAMDISFLLATICNLFYFRKRKTIFGLNLFSLVMICVALIIKILGWEYPEILVVFWSFYIFFYYFTLTVHRIWKYPQ